MKHPPLISVVLPVYNSEKYITECIQSILDQSFTDFELLIFNDGSQDSSIEKINFFKDQRIRLFDSPENVGYVKLLNKGIAESNGKYIVRMDADDICLNDRFRELVNFMEDNPNVGVCGSYVRVFGNVKEYIWKLPTQNDAIKAMLPFRIPFIHPSVIIRKQILTDNALEYKNEFLPAEDYEFWCNLSGYTQFANIPKVLLKYRQHQNQISKEKRNIQQNNSNIIRNKYFRRLFLSESDFKFYQDVVNESIECSKSFLERLITIYKSMEEVNKTGGFMDQEALHNELSFQLFRVATHVSSNNVKTLSILKRSGFKRSPHISGNAYLKYIVKNLV